MRKITQARITMGTAAEARRRAEEWRQFRRDFLYSQHDLAEALGCSRRTIVNIETGLERHPMPNLLRRFAALKREQERMLA